VPVATTPKVLLRRRALLVGVTGNDHRQLQPGRGSNEWRVKRWAAQTVANDADASRRMGWSRRVSGA